MFGEPATSRHVGWDFLFGVTAVLGAWGGGTIGQSDWTRYARRKYAPTVSQLLAAPATIAATAVVGIVVASASRDVLGSAVEWSPIHLLAAIQDHYRSSPGVRAAVFLASLGLIASQLLVRLAVVGRAPARPLDASANGPRRSPSCSSASARAWTLPASGPSTSTSDAAAISWPSSASPPSRCRPAPRPPVG